MSHHKKVFRHTKSRKIWFMIKKKKKKQKDTDPEVTQLLELVDKYSSWCKYIPHISECRENHELIEERNEK